MASVASTPTSDPPAVTEPTPMTDMPLLSAPVQVPIDNKPPDVTSDLGEEKAVELSAYENVKV